MLSGHLAVWEQLEKESAQFAGTEAAPYFGSGYMANLGLMTALLKKDDLVFSDALNHASLLDGMRLSDARKITYSHLDLNTLEAELQKICARTCPQTHRQRERFSYGRRYCSVTQIIELAERYGAGVIVD